MNWVLQYPIRVYLHVRNRHATHASKPATMGAANVVMVKASAFNSTNRMTGSRNIRYKPASTANVFLSGSFQNQSYNLLFTLAVPVCVKPVEYECQHSHKCGCRCGIFIDAPLGNAHRPKGCQVYDWLSPLAHPRTPPLTSVRCPNWFIEFVCYQSCQFIYNRAN